MLEQLQTALGERVLAFLATGGPVLLVLIALSVFAITILVAKLLQFRAERVGDNDRAETAVALYREGRLGDAMAMAEADTGPASQVVARALHGVQRGLPKEMVREEVTRYARDTLEALRGWLRALEVIGSLAPLLGLLGTVLGMIEAFQELEAAGNQVNPAVLSGGIWEALLTTAVGLTVAIPVVAALNWLERRIDRQAHHLEDLITRVFTEDLTTVPTAWSEAHEERPGLRAAASHR